MNQIIMYTIASVFIVSCISFVGALTLLIKKDLSKKMLLILVSLSAGTLFGGAFLHLLPEAVGDSGLTTRISFLVLSGVVVFFVLEKIIHYHHCHSHQFSKDKHNHEHSAMAPLNLVGDGLHNFLDGVVIASAYIINIPLGIATTIAVVVHEIPQEIADFGVLLYSGFSKKKALLFNFLSGAIAIIGAGVGLYFGGNSELFTKSILPFAAGGFLYIAGSNLIPELQKDARIKESVMHFIALLVGIGLMYGLTLLE